MATGKNTDGTVAVITWGYKEDADFHFIQNFVNEFAQKYPNVKMVFHRLDWEDDEVLIITGENYDEELFPDN
jgi:ABC-type glycerol-3-phosphate transport system substrate-binding protein